jgi:hypothetical protein
MQIQNEFETNLREVPAASKALSLAPIHDLKPKTWYYGLRCACERLLALCEDCLRAEATSLSCTSRRCSLSSAAAAQ